MNDTFIYKGFIEEVKGALNRGGSSAPADWNANEGEPGHILNRTHYEVATVVYPETILITDEGGNAILPGTFDVDPNKTYRVTFNGEVVDALVIPVESMYGMVLMRGTDDPILMIISGALFGDDANMSVQWFSEPDFNATISITEIAITKIPEKFLPDNQKTYTVDIPTDSINWQDSDLADLTGSDILYDEFIDILFGGGNVFVKTDALVMPGLAEDVVYSGVFGRVISYYWFGNDTNGLLFVQAYGRSKTGATTTLITFKFLGTKRPSMV